MIAELVNPGGGGGLPKFKQGPPSLLELSPISQHFEIGRLVGSAGPELVWKIYDARRKSDNKESSVFFFEKKVAEKIHKPKRKETVSEILRFGVRQLERYKSPKLLSLAHPIEESNDSLAFATEPVMGSLANILGCLEDRLPQAVAQETRDYEFLDIEHRYGLLQLTEALLFLHYNAKLIHRNVCPSSVLVNRKGTWKLAGLEFSEKCNESDNIMSAIGCQGFTSKLPKMGQPDLDYTPPEVHATSSCSPQSDMFSLGLLITALFNQGHSLLESQLSISVYTQRIEEMDRNLHSLLEKIPHHLQEPLQGLLNMDAKRRPTSQNFSIIKYFMDPGVHALQYLDVIQMKDSTHKTHYYHNLKQTLPAIPKKLWWQHILPSLQAELQSPEVLAAALQPLLFMISDSTPDEYQTIILPIFRSVFGMPKSVQATVTLLENIDVLMAKSPKADIRADILPMVYNSFESTAPQIQCASMRAAAHVAEFLDENAVRRMVLPRTRSVFETSSGQKPIHGVSSQVQANALTCIEQVMDKLDKSDTLDQLLPVLEKAKLNDPAVLMPVVRIYRRMLDDKRYGLTPHPIATKALPSLIPVAVSPALKPNQFQELIELCQELLDTVAKNQKNKLKLDKPSLQPSPEVTPAHTQQQTPMQFHAIEQPTGYPHRPPSLRLESRRASISMDDVVRRTCGSATSSPDSNLLRVQATLPGRRHSDNTIQPPRILVAPCSPGAGSPLGYTSSGSPVRRHSSVGMHQQDSRFSNFFSPKFQSPTTSASPSHSMGLGADFFNSSRANMRRYSAAAVCSGASGLPNQASSFLQQVGSGVSSLFTNK